YRISVVQLPRDAASGAPGVAMLMHLSLPVFVTPARALPRLDAAAASLQHDRLRVQLHNRGTATLAPRRLSVRLLDAARGEVGRQTVETWYLLPGEQRDLELRVDPALCGRLAAIEMDPGASLAQSTVALTAAAGTSCGP
ncbi:MAG TPA: hypothetical protein VMF13_07770, partial [Luteitalea sp.]|nr:hypothetical protein [Luteitalea sp.]